MRRRILGGNITPPVNTTPNTFIGGVAATIPTAQALATKLSTIDYPLTESDIPYFVINGSDIEATISKNYQIPSNAFDNDVNITSYEDTGAVLAKVGGSAFFSADNFRKFHANGNPILGAYFLRQTTSVDVNISNVTSLVDLAFYNAGLSVLDMRKVLTIGSNTLDNNVFEIITGNPIIYANSSLQTANAGGLEGDLADAQARGATIIFV